MPTSSWGRIQNVLRKSRVVAISPFLRDSAFSGPAATFMRAAGYEPSTLGVAKLYSKFLKLFIVDSLEEVDIVKRVKDMGIECLRLNTRMAESSRLAIAKEIMESL